MLKFSLSFLAYFVSVSLAPAAEACEACRAGDEQQIGNYVEPAIPVQPLIEKPDPRGKSHTIPLPGGPATVRVKPGSGLWLGSPGENQGDIFVNGSLDKASVNWRLGF